MVGQYPKLRHANERALVIAAMDLPYWIFPVDGRFALCVESAHFQKALDELALYEKERRQNPFLRFRNFRQGAREPISASLFVSIWVMAFFFLLQKTGPAWWVDAGDVSPKAIFQQGEWWRIVTALTLHADFAHIGANLATGILFAFFLLPMLGVGVTWSAILLSGALGNLLNAFFYRGEAHYSIGASTAVFGALGILVGAQTIRLVVASSRKLRIWEIILPIGAGAALLAFLGTGDKERSVDFMAHFWGFVAGVPMGVLAKGFRLKKRVPAGLQLLLAGTAMLVPGACWAFAILSRVH